MNNRRLDAQGRDLWGQWRNSPPVVVYVGLHVPVCSVLSISLNVSFHSNLRLKPPQQNPPFLPLTHLYSSSRAVCQLCWLDFWFQPLESGFGTWTWTYGSPHAPHPLLLNCLGCQLFTVSVCALLIHDMIQLSFKACVRCGILPPPPPQ